MKSKEQYIAEGIKNLNKKSLLDLFKKAVRYYAGGDEETNSDSEVQMKPDVFLSF